MIRLANGRGRNAPHELRHPPVHPVAGRLSRQGEIDAPRFLVCQELIGCASAASVFPVPIGASMT